jgi:hypothetical protein
MKLIISLVATAVIAGIAFNAACGRSQRSSTDAHMIPAAAHDSTSFALLELFTSEGCSSCPSADKLLGQIAADARRTGARIIPLAFHVDDWNRLGWTDPFSSSAYSQRQYDYATALGLDGVYTPQLVVNGGAEFVGSNGTKASEAIEGALAMPAPTRIALTASLDGRSVRVGYDVAGTIPGNAMLNLAIVERGLSTNVPRGENAGRTLRHENVVRLFTSVAPERSGSRMLTIPDGVDVKNASVVAYVQEKSMKITGAAMVDLAR